VAEQLTFEHLKKAVTGRAAAFRCRTKLQPDGGNGGKVFPPTYAGGVYAVEDRRIDGKVVRCVLLDSVQSQANRMEEALQQAFLPNWRELPTNGEKPSCDLPVLAVHIENHGWVTSLTAPHRIHDAILRDSNLNGTRFRESDIGQAVVRARVWNATALYKYCPTALLFGTWDSTAGEGLDSAKIPRAVVSEIIGVDITAGVRTGSRVDPLGIKAQSATVYRRSDGGWAIQDENGGWIGGNDADIERDKNNDFKKFGKGKPSDINHGNVTPDLARFGDRRDVQNQHLDQLPDVLKDDPVSLSYEMRARDGELRHQGRADSRSVAIAPHAVRPGGVTMDHALHTWTLSLTQLRRLRFPVDGSPDEERNNAARTVLAALALYARALQQDRGYWLRSRCELVGDDGYELELIGGVGGTYQLGEADRVKTELFDPAYQEALDWEQSVIRLTPTDQLAELVRRSDARQPEAGDEAGEGAADAGAQS